MACGVCKAPWRRTNSRERFCCCCCIPALAVPAAGQSGFFLVSFPHGGMGVGLFVFLRAASYMSCVCAGGELGLFKPPPNNFFLVLSVRCFGVSSVYSTALLCSWLFGYIKHDLNICSCFEKIAFG